MFRAKRLVPGITVALAAAIVGVPACGSTGSTGSTAAPPGGAATTTSLSGAPYTYYVIYSSVTNSPFPELPKAAQLGVDAVNSSGGINGHPLRLKTCPVNLDLNKAAGCAREAVADPAVIAADVWLGQPEVVLDTFRKARLPVIGDYPLAIAHFSCQVCFPSSAGAFASVAGQGLLAATQLKAQRVSFVVVDVPAARGLATLVSQLLQATGQSTKVVKVVSVPLTAGDLSAQVTAASQDVDAMLVTLAMDSLPRFLRTAAQLGVKLPVVTVPLDQKQVAQIGPPAEGTYHVGAFSHGSPGFTDFQKAFSARNPDDPPSDAAYSFWLGTQLLQRASKGQPEVTRQSALAAMGKLKDVDTGGATPPLDFTKQFTGFGGKLPRLFNNTVVYYQVHNGTADEISDFQPLMPSA
jgi:ABC-type branched-subunit amino acid transport system substrate-binding protein